LSANADPARRLRLILVPVAAAGLAGLVACGTGAAAASSAGAPDDTAMAAFASCMAENGVTLPERGAPDGGAGSAGDAAAGSGGAGAGSAGRVATGAGSAGGVAAGAGGAGGVAAGAGGAGSAAGPGAGGASPPSGAPQAGGAGSGGAMPAPPGVDATAWAAAQEACAQYAPTAP